MGINRHLIHRCTLILPGEVTATDPYQRKVTEDVQHAEVPCLADSITKRVSRDDYGVDVIQENLLFLGGGQQLHEFMIVQDIRDKNGNPVLAGVFSVQKIQPIYGRRKLDHFEITLKKESDTGG